MQPISKRFQSLWTPASGTAQRIESLAREYRTRVRETVTPIVAAWHPELIASGSEYAKMLELTTKMTLVGHACSVLTGYPFDARRQRIAMLFGCCCFLADSFLDDFGAEATRVYLRRFARLLSSGWFDVRNERERLFYVVVARLFGERDVLVPLLRQAILRLHAAQERDVMLRLEPKRLSGLIESRRRVVLKCAARDRSGHAILVLTLLLVPALPLEMLTLLFTAGALIMFIDDHGDCFTDRRDGRVTYMNYVRQPERVLERIALAYFARLSSALPQNEGRELLLGFLLRYYLTRIDKHREQRRRGGTAWDVFE